MVHRRCLLGHRIPGAIDIEQRSQGDAYRAFADAGIPRDGGLADLLTEAKAPAPKFAAVVCEDIERSGRDTFNALKLEKELSRGIIHSSHFRIPPLSQLWWSARRKVLHNSTGKDERFLRMTGNLGHGNGPSF